MLRSGVPIEEEKDESFVDHFKEAGHGGGNKVTRKIINSAIYVEKPLSAVSSESGFLSKRASTEDVVEVKIKRCTCSLNQKGCQFHWNNHLSASLSTEKRENPPTSTSCLKAPENKTKVSHYPESVKAVDDDKKRVIKKWNVKKDEEKKKKGLVEEMTLKTKIRDKERLLEQERKNFKEWLMHKKKLEIEAKKSKEKQLEEQQLKELEKERKQLENQLNFQLWLKKKEEALLEKKIKQQLEVINELEQKEKHLRDNENAFNEWLKNSKNKPKPAPLNKGIESLCSSPSVTYVNPNPWNSIS